MPLHAQPERLTIPSNASAGLWQRLHIDVPLLVGLMLLCGIGFLILYSAGGQDVDLLVRQGLRLGLAFGLMVGLAQATPQQLRRYSPALYVLGVVLLLAVLVAGVIGKGAQRWLDLGLFRFQPSEILKIATPMMIAWYLAVRPLPPRWPHLAGAGLMIVVPAVLIAKQPDLGTALLVACSGAAVLFIAGLSWRFLFGAAIACAALTPLVWRYYMHDYQRARVKMLFNPELDALGSGYHIIQSKIAIGSGGLFGKGWLNGTQSHLDFLPERSTDFIFAVFAEEFGLIGCIGLLLLYLLIVGRCLLIAAQANDTYSRLLAGGLTITFFVYVFVNIGMVIGLLPVVGVPLPLISYGGTSMVTLLAGFGLLMSIRTHPKLIES